MAAHARLSPSAAERWMTCPGSVLRSQIVPEDRSSVYSAEGTCAHEIRALCLELGLEPHDFVGQTWVVDGFTFEITNEMADYLTAGIDRVRDLPGKLVVEHRVDLGKWLPGQFGTLDAGVVGSDEIRIDDLKYGQGEVVSVERNKQLMLYALGFWDNVARHISAATEFVLSIDQPRVAGRGGEWRVSLDELLAFGEEARAAAERTYEPDAPLVASAKACRWCPLVREGGPGCAAHEAFNLDIVSQKFDALDEDIALAAPPTLPRYSAITPERRAHIIEHASMFAKWLEGLKVEALADAIAGRPTPGQKAVVGDVGDRKWGDEVAAEALLTAHLRDDAFTKKLKSPAQVEKVAKPGKRKPGLPDLWSGAQELITRAPGRPILVPLSDARPALTSNEQKFTEIMDSQED